MYVLLKYRNVSNNIVSKICCDHVKRRLILRIQKKEIHVPVCVVHIN